MTTQTEQTELFPKTTMEVLESLRAFHVADVEKAGTALDNLSDDEKIARRYEKAEERLAAARDLVRDIDRAIKELRGMEPTVEEVAADIVTMVDAGDFDGAGLVVSAIRNFVDPITGEVTVEPLPGADGSTLDDPGPETPVPALDPITSEGLEEVTGTVHVTYPGETVGYDTRSTNVGSRTQYAELVADYLAALPAVSSHQSDPVTYYRVIGVDDEIDRDLRSPIAPDDYGVELAVVRLADVQEANELLEDAVR